MDSKEYLLKLFKKWLVMYDVDMLMSQHQLDWEDVGAGIAGLMELREHSPLAPINFPDGFNPSDIKGHTHVCTTNKEER